MANSFEVFEPDPSDEIFSPGNRVGSDFEMPAIKNPDGYDVNSTRREIPSERSVKVAGEHRIRKIEK